MLHAKFIRSLFTQLNEELSQRGVVGEIGLCGGAVMCLVFDARDATKDVDGIFEPTQEIRAAARVVARSNDLSEDWLNDAAKAYFHGDPPRVEVLNLSHLRVWAPTAEYMLAMKCVSARFDSQDKEDVEFLVSHRQLQSPDEVFSILCQYYPRNLIPPQTQSLVKELLV